MYVILIHVFFLPLITHNYVCIPYSWLMEWTDSLDDCIDRIRFVCMEKNFNGPTYLLFRLVSYFIQAS